MDRKASLVLSAVGALALTGCGGGSSSSGTGAVAVAPAPVPIPSPSPTPTPSPSPTPTPTPLAGPAALTQVRDFAVLGYSVTGVTDGQGRGSLVQQPGGVAFRYIASESRHEMMIPSRDWGILGAASNYATGFSRQRVTVGSGASAFAYDLNLFVPGDRNGVLALVHTSYGSWAASALNPTDPSRVDQNFGSFAYGVPTPANGVPRTGMNAYHGVVFDSYDTSGNVSISIDFATGQVSGTIEPFFNDGIGGIGSGGTHPLSGSIQPGASTFQLNFPVGSTGRTGLIEVQLTGPAAEELMLRWSAMIAVPHLEIVPRAYILPGLARRI